MMSSTIKSGRTSDRVADEVAAIQFVHEVAVSLQISHDDFADRWFVIDDQHPCRATVHAITIRTEHPCVNGRR